MRIAVDHLLPNPFRHVERYPLKPDKVAALVESINTTQFWDNLLARPAEKKGFFELAYGHHRLEALTLSNTEIVNIPVRDLSDEAMLKIMSRENMAEWKHSTEVEQETVRATVQAFAEGKVKLPPVSGDRSTVRFAPFFAVGEVHGHIPTRPWTGIKAKKKATTTARDDKRHLAYTPKTLAAFLGMKLYAVTITLDALAELDAGLVEDEDFSGLTTQEARQVVMQARRANKLIPDTPEKKQRVRGIIKSLVSGMRKSTGRPDASGKMRFVKDVTVHNARAKADELIKGFLPKEKRQSPEAAKFIDKLLVALRLPTDKMIKKLDALYAERLQLDAADITRLAGALRGAGDRFLHWANRFDGGIEHGDAYTTEHTTVVPITRRIGSH